jgi:hypothetical protein
MHSAIRLYLQNLVAALPEEFSRRPASITSLAFRPTTLVSKNNARQDDEGRPGSVKNRRTWIGSGYVFIALLSC